MKGKARTLPARPGMFRELYDQQYAGLKSQVFDPGINSGLWTGGATRQRVRALARKQARAEMRKLRDKMRFPGVDLKQRNH